MTTPGAAPAAGAALEDWLASISAQPPATIALGLERVREVAARMALPRPPVVITVGGTNGKGSTRPMLERMLLEAGYRVGCYTSPHLMRYNERVRVAGGEAGDRALSASFWQVVRA